MSLIKNDFIVAGFGLTGHCICLELAKRTENFTVLVIDKEAKIAEDRTWSFWSDNTASDAYLESIACKYWDNIIVKNNNICLNVPIAPS